MPRHKLFSVTVVSALAVLACSTGMRPVAGEAPDGAEVVEWVERGGYDNEERLATRPGNIAAFGAICDYYEGLYEMRPSLRAVKYPMFRRGQWVESAEAYELSLVAYEQECKREGTQPSNRFRATNYDVEEFKSFQLTLGSHTDTDLVALGMKERLVKELRDVLAKHGETGSLVRIKIRSLSLQSDKIEHDYWQWFYLVRDGLKCAIVCHLA